MLEQDEQNFRTGCHFNPDGITKTLLRVDGDALATSSMARIPLVSFIKFYPWLKSYLRMTPEEKVAAWPTRLHPRPFKLQSVGDDTINVDCLIVPMDEIEKVAQELGINE